jgi:DNA-binding CsgD family transcriptional regulator
MGQRWEGARLAGHTAAPASDRRDTAALMEFARDLLATSSSCGSRPTGPSPAESQAGVVPLSPREREVAELVLAGLTYRQIGESLYLSAKTVEHHMARIKRRRRTPRQRGRWSRTSSGGRRVACGAVRQRCGRRSTLLRTATPRTPFNVVVRRVALAAQSVEGRVSLGNGPNAIYLNRAACGRSAQGSFVRQIGSAGCPMRPAGVKELYRHKGHPCARRVLSRGWAGERTWRSPQADVPRAMPRATDGECLPLAVARILHAS